MKLTIDVENTVSRLPSGKLLVDPFTEGNKLVLLCAKTDDGQEYSFWFDHSTHKTDNARVLLQELLDKTTTLICHNAQHELIWLWETGFTYHGAVFDTMLVEYLFQQSIKEPLSLEAIGKRYELCILLAKIYCRGFSIDKEVLTEVKSEFKTEQNTIKRELDEQVYKLMGDTPINLASPEQLSMVIYSRKPVDKSMWSDNFSKYMKKQDFNAAVNTNSEYVYRTIAVQCKDCFGKGYNLVIKKDGTTGKAKRICRTCDHTGIIYVPNKKIAGLKFTAPSASWVANHGFSTSKTNIKMLEETAKRRGLSEAQSFLHKVIRLSALDTYLSSFVEGIETFTKADNKLHVRLVQHRTTTGRLASDSPNLQNMPRGNTFPIKKVFRSRWKDGCIIEAAAFLGDDEIAKKEINSGFDVHSYTADIISSSGQIITRQEAKAHTFAPLFGATGFGRTTAEAAYYKQFTEKYSGIARWHTKLANEVMSTGMVTTPTGRQFAFPKAERRQGGTITYFTAVKNYPVQSISTDIVQLTLLLVEEEMRKRKLKSMIVNSVHDSIVVDTYFSEKDHVKSCIMYVEQQLRKSFLQKFEVDFTVPLVLECKIGNNWMELQEYS